MIYRHYQPHHCKRR